MARLNWDRAKREAQAAEDAVDNRLEWLPEGKRPPKWADLPADRKIGSAVGWAQKWRTWPKGGDVGAADIGATLELQRNPNTTKREVAIAAIRAAEQRQR